MQTLTDPERRLLEMLATEGKPTWLLGNQLTVAESLEEAELVFFVRGGHAAIITPKGRHLLAELEQAAKTPKPPKPPIGFRD
jgi:hypothetical protein